METKPPGTASGFGFLFFPGLLLGDPVRTREKKMSTQEKPKCTHCGTAMEKWEVPTNSTWGTKFLWVCFNDECPYFVRGWDHMMKTQEVKASYRHSINPDTGTASPLPCWSYDAHKDKLIQD